MRKLLLFPVLMALYVLGCSGDSNMPCGSCGDDSKCGNEWYNSSGQFCFGGSIYDKCGGMVFSADKQGCCGVELYDLSTKFCSCDVAYSYYCSSKVYDKCGGREYNLSTQLRCQNNVIETKCGTNYWDWYNAANADLRCENNAVEIKCGSLWYNSLTYLCIDGMAVKEGTFMDTRESKSYKWVKIGTQVWMAENLNYNASGSKCYAEGVSGVSADSIAKNCAKYGRLYNWSTAMGIDTRYNSELWNGSDVKHKGICPTGWHLPSNAEWGTLTDFVGGSSTAGTKLKSKSGWNDSGNGTDEFGFSALPGGYGGSDGSFSNAGYDGYWWSASESYRNYYAYLMNLYYQFTYYFFFDKSDLYSVRCLQD